MLWPVITGVLGGLLLLAALYAAGEIVEETFSWFGERIGIGVLRIATLGRYPKPPVSGSARFLATILGLFGIVAAAVWALNLWRAV
jgi:hypothetical protein